MILSKPISSLWKPKPTPLNQQDSPDEDDIEPLAGHFFRRTALLGS